MYRNDSQGSNSTQSTNTWRMSRSIVSGDFNNSIARTGSGYSDKFSALTQVSIFASFCDCNNQCQKYYLVKNPGKEQKLDKIPTGDKEAKLFITIGEWSSVKILQTQKIRTLDPF